MVAYVDEMPDMSVMRKTENTIVAEGMPVYAKMRVIVKCQTRNKPQ